MDYRIVIEPLAIQDIQQAIDYYDDIQSGLGQKFVVALNKHFVSLSKNPFFQIRYDEVHCLPIKNYPYMIHFTIRKTHREVIVRAVFHTSQNIDKWKNR